MSKFDFFEEGIRRVFDNYELPIEENSWATYQAGLNAGKATNFLKLFALPGLLIAGLFGAMHLSTLETEIAQHKGSEDHSSIRYNTDNGSTDIHGHDLRIADGTETSEKKTISDISSITTDNSNDELNSSDHRSTETLSSNDQSTTSNSLNTLVNGNNIYTENADPEDGLAVGPKKTKYEGSNYKLGAPEKFTPNNDNRNDTFLPPLLTKDSNFWMRIYDRGGNIVFETKNINNPWDGTVLDTNKPAELGEYRWNVILETDNKLKEYEGKVKLVR